MEVVILDDVEAIAKVAASIVTDLVDRRPDAVLGLATGDSPRRTYELLVEAHQRGALSFAAARAVTLDEYIGLPPDHPHSYRRFILDALVDHIDLPRAGLHTPDVHAGDLLAACEAFENDIRELGGVDLQILGIGSDGHIGFNEPGSSLASRTRIKTLHSQTRTDNARFFDSADDVPRHVITQGIGTILDSRHALVIATGEHKAAAVAAMAEGPVTAFVPASALQLHRHVTALIDTAAASQLRLADYYRYTHANKPDWQRY